MVILDPTPWLEQLPDSLNRQYFLSLVRLWEEAQSKSQSQDRVSTSMRLLEQGLADVNEPVWIPTAIASPELTNTLPLIQYSDCQTFRESAQEVHLQICKMHAGTGSSIQRERFLAAQKSLDPKNIRLGAKSTDLQAQVASHPPIALAEIQLLQALALVRAQEVRSVWIQDLVGPETQASMEALWKNPVMGNPSQSFDEVFQNTDGAKRGISIFQAKIPTIHDGRLSSNRLAPGGHGIFGFWALFDILEKKSLSQVPEGDDLITVIGNGEDLSSTPDAAILGWMRAKQIPLAMVTTDKTGIDLKGGQIAFEVYPDQKCYVTIVEKAQAEQSDQVELFTALGLREGDRKALFNTNMALFNHRALHQKLCALKNKIGDDKFQKAISPSLIQNSKKQRDSDGETRTYTQLEGAMGSVLLNLDRTCREYLGEPVVHFINVEQKYRTRFFMPIKSAFDYWMVCHSDRFSIDPKTFQIEDHRPGELPKIDLAHPEYAQVDRVLECFKDTKIIELAELWIEGLVDCSELELAGQVIIVRDSKDSPEPIRLNDCLDRQSLNARLQDCRLRILKNGEIEIQSLGGQ